MKVFTYYQYIKFIHKVRLNAVLQLAEEGEEYHLETKKQEPIHDRLVKNILTNKEEMAKLINDFLNPKQIIKSEDLTRYTNSYITKKYKAKEADLVYKLNNREIFFLVEHQSTVDPKMPYRILNYSVDIMQEWSRNKKVGKNILYPIIAPIVIYTGNQKWNIPKNFQEKQIGDYLFERHNIELEYNLIDINKLSKQFLLQKNSLFCYGMMIEKAKDKEELKDILKDIINVEKDMSKLDEIANIILYVLDKSLEKEEQEELLEKINEKVGDKQMSTLIERLRAENQRMIRQGIEQGKTEVAENMLKLNLQDEIILKVTKIKAEKLEKIKRKILITD